MWKLQTSERMARWRDFRKQLTQMSMDDALLATVEFWRTCPYTPYYLEPSKPETWPDPWQLVEENYYCDVAKALGILYTVYLSEHKNSIEYEIRIYKDPETGFIYNLVYLNQGKYVLNLVDSEIVNNTSIDKKFKLLHCYDSSVLNLEKY
jgi:hypothetical protein